MGQFSDFRTRKRGPLFSERKGRRGEETTEGRLSHTTEDERFLCFGGSWPTEKSVRKNRKKRKVELKKIITSLPRRTLPPLS